MKSFLKPYLAALWNPFKTVERPRNIVAGFLGSSAMAGFLLASYIAIEGRGPGMGVVGPLAYAVTPLLLAILELFTILPCYGLLLVMGRLSFITLYLAATISSFLASLWWSLSGDIEITGELVLARAAVCSVVFLVLVSLFWLFSTAKAESGRVDQP